MVPVSMSFVVMLRDSLPESCNLPPLTRVEAIKVFPLTSRDPPELIFNVLETFVLSRRETLGLDIVKALKFVGPSIVWSEEPSNITFPVPGWKLEA